MKEHFQDQGVRKWAGDDLIELQAESLAALQGLVEPYAPCIIKGCEVSLVSGSNYKVSAGLVALPGNDHTGVPCVKVARVDEIPSTVLPVYLTLTYTTDTRVYSDGKSKEISHNYTANVSTVQPEGGDYLTIGVDGGSRLVDTLGITAKLEREGGEAKDVKVTFAQASSRILPESGNKLGIIIGIVRKWFADLKALAFKDKVAEGDLESSLSTKINNKVDKVTGKGLSANDFTNALKDKLDGIDVGAEVNVQADWSVSSSSSDAYIRNKPTSLPPNGSAGGDLSGTYPSPTIRPNVNLSGSPTTTTQVESDNSTRIATTAFVQKIVGNVEKKVSSKVWFTHLSTYMSSSSPSGGLFNTNNSRTLYEMGVRTGDLLFYNLQSSSMEEICVGKVLLSSSSKVVVSYHDYGGNDISYFNNRLFGKYNLPAATSSERGGIKTGYTSTANNRAVQTSNEKAYVNIPTATTSTTGLMSSADKVAVDEFKSSLRIVSAFTIEPDGSISQCVGLVPTGTIGSRGDATGKTYLIKLNASAGFSLSKRYGAMALAGYGHTIEKYEQSANGNGYISLIQRNLSGEPELSGFAPWVILFELN